MKKGTKLGGTPGFRYDGKTKTATFNVIIPGTGGKARRQRRVGGLTRDKALEAWRAYRDEVLNPPPPPSPAAEPLTLARYVDLHWTDITLSASTRTRRGYSTHLRHLILPELGALPLAKINAASLRDFSGRMKAGINVTASRGPKPGGYAPNTINHCTTIVRRILLDAVDRGDLTVYPIARRMKKEKPVQLKLELSDEERTRFLGAFDDAEAFRLVWQQRREEDAKRRAETPGRHGGPWEPTGEAVAEHFSRFRSSKPFFVVALETGLRLGDLLALRWPSVDLAGGWVRVRMSKTKEEAVIPISPDLKAALNVLRFGRTDDGLVFATGEEPWSWTVLARYFRIAKKAAGIERRFRFHDCRHSFASRLASAGVSLQVIAKMLGHTTVQMSQRYARPDELALRNALEMVRDTARMKTGMKTLGDAVSGSTSGR